MMNFLVDATMVVKIFEKIPEILKPQQILFLQSRR